MKRIVDIYVESISGSGDYLKLELFNDEKIELTSTIQNIQDISKVYTDFTQSFTIPASTINNSILHHFYQSDVNITNNEWNFNFRIRARIEIDLVPFRTGTIMMEKANIKDGRTDSYTITFYGDLVSLKDKFGDAKLSDLDFTSYDIEYTGTNVINRVKSSTLENVMFPLISSKRLWSYGDGASTDVKTVKGSIKNDELFPALKVARILDAIEAKFDVEFNSQFFVSTNDKWEKLYLWLKNEEQYTGKTSSTPVNIVAPSGQTIVPGFTMYPYSVSPVHYTGFSGFYFDGSFFTCKSVGNVTNPFGSGLVSIDAPTLQISVQSVSDATIEYYIDLYKDGKVVKTKTSKGKFSPLDFYTFAPSDNGSVFFFRIRTKAPMTLNLDATLNYKYYNNYNQPIFIPSTTTTTKTDLSSKMPSMTVAEFFSGLLKMFNATCYATSVDVFTIEPLDMWYNGGNIYDITNYTDIDSIDVERTNVFKKLSFKYQKSESFLNREYYDNGIMEREYADTNLTLSNEGTDYSVELPFENLLMNNLNVDNFQVGYCLTKGPDFKSYIPKPVFLYFNERINDTLYMNNGTTSTLCSDFNIFSNVLESNGGLYSLTFHPESDVKIPNDTLTNNLYSLYYSSYLENLFNPKCRLIRIKAHFPLSLITKLRLNDRLIVRDKRYIINELKSDITSGEVSLTLINDFRPMLNDAITPTIVIPSGGGTVTIPYKVPNGVISTTFSSGVAGTTISPGSTTTDASIEVTAPVNPYTPTPIWTESTTDVIITDDGWGIVNEEGFGVVIPVDATNLNNDGTTFTNTINLLQE
jgi:hypothetical protein